MRIIRLDEEKKQNILEGLLKRDPNQYGQYADTVQQIVDEGQRRGQITRDLPAYEIARYYTMCERAIIYDYCISDANYDLGEFTARTIPMLLYSIRGDR